MSARSKRAAAVLSKTLRKERSQARKSVRQEAKERIEEAGVGRKSAGAPSKPASKVAAFGGPVGGFAPRTPLKGRMRFSSSSTRTWR